MRRCEWVNYFGTVHGVEGNWYFEFIMCIDDICLCPLALTLPRLQLLLHA